MRKYLYCENGFVEKPQWMPNCWVNVECPDQSDFEFLTKELKVPEAFLEDNGYGRKLATDHYPNPPATTGKHPLYHYPHRYHYKQ